MLALENADDVEGQFRFDAHIAAAADGARRSERTRARLRIAACRFLDGRPPGALTVADICKAAGVAHGTFYLYFADRNALLADLLAEFVDFVQQTMLTFGRAGRSDPVRGATLAYYRLFEQNPGLMKCLVHRLEDFPEAQQAFQRLNREWVDRVVAALRRTRPQIRADDDELTRRAYALGGMIDQYLGALLLSRDPSLAAVSPDAETVLDTLTELWNRGFER